MFNDKKVLVLGAARSGIWAAKILSAKGAHVLLADSKERDSIKSDLSVLDNSVEFHFGGNPDEHIIREYDFVIASPGIPCDAEPFRIAEKHNIPVLSEIEMSYLLTPCHIAAITGTNGKTTTTALTGEILKLHKDNTFVVGNIGTPFSMVLDELNPDSFIVAEISSFQLEFVNKFKPKISAVLNISPDHLDRHKTMANYVGIKERIFRNNDEDCFVVLNYDDILTRNMAYKAKCNIVFFSRLQSIKNGVFLNNDDIVINFKNFADLKDINEKVIDINDLKILGFHNIENAMAAIAICYCAGVPVSVIKKGLESFKGVSHRIEFVAKIGEVNYYNDSKGTNTDASIKAIEAMNQPTVLIAGGYDKNADYTGFINSFGNKIKHLIVTGDTAEKIANTASTHGFKNITYAKDYDEAVSIAKTIAKSGENVLLSPACASFDMFNNYEERGDYFKKIVNGMR